MSVARDGTGGLVFLAKMGGQNRLYVSRLLGGVFQPAERIDGALSGASSQPVVAAGNGGLLLVAFINSGNLYVAEAASADSPWGSPVEIHGAASSPSIQMSNVGKAYLAFAAAGNGGSDILADYSAGGAWAPVSGPLNVTPGDDAGTGAGRPKVATAGDGLGIVAWGEGGHVFARRVWGTSASTVVQQLDPSSYAGAGEVSAGDPELAVGGNSSYVDIAFQETVHAGAGTRTRVLMSRLVSANLAPATAIDGLSASGADSAVSPSVAMGEYGRGYALAVDQAGEHLIGTPLSANGYPGPVGQLDASPSTSQIFAVPGISGPNSTFVTWQQAPVLGAPQIVLRYGDGSTDLGSPILLSGGATGAPDGTDGLTAAGDNGGDVAVAWVQSSGGALGIDATQLYQAPGSANPTARRVYTRRAQPVLSWGAATYRWGPITYTVTMGGSVIGRTTATQLLVPTPLIDGPHRWQVTAANPGGGQATGSPATVFVDTTPPRLRISLSAGPRAGTALTLRIHAADRPAAQPGARASGLRSVSVSWGDGSGRVRGVRLSDVRHTYARKGAYVITVRATDRAGNRTTIRRSVHVKPATRPHRKGHHK